MLSLKSNLYSAISQIDEDKGTQAEDTKIRNEDDRISDHETITLTNEFSDDKQVALT